MKIEKESKPTIEIQTYQYVPEYEEFRHRKLGDVPFEFNPEKSVRDWNKFFARQ